MTILSRTVTRLYREARSAGYAAQHAFQIAKTVCEFTALGDDKVRLIAEDEQENYFDVFGRDDDEKQNAAIVRWIELYGNYCCVAQWFNVELERWQSADSIGQCAGYRNVLDWRENCHIPDLMQSAIDAYQAQFEPIAYCCD